MVGIITNLVLTLHALTQATSALRAPKQCSLPAPGEDFETATPSEVLLSEEAVKKAIGYATTHSRTSVQVFRYNCLVAQEILGNITEQIPTNVFSVTKSVVSMLTGIAQSQGKLSYTDEIGKYLPPGKAWGNKRHRKITILDLLTETAGFTEAILAEAGTVGVDSSAPQEALAQPIIHKPGTFFSYSQRVPDLLNYVVQSAVGQDIQAFAQQYLFDPLGIPEDDYFWLRDRSGYTYGYAFLFIEPKHLARLGLLAQHHGKWNDQQIVPASYIHNVSASSEHNPCYGWLFWTNKNKPCTSANIPAAQTYHSHLIPSAPTDLFAMIGALQQNAFMIPSLDMTVVWTGNFGDTDPNLAGLISAGGGNLYNNFFARLLPGVENVKVKPAGVYETPPLDLDVNPFDYASPLVLLHDIDANPDCNILVCNGGIPSNGSIENLQKISQVILAAVP